MAFEANEKDKAMRHGRHTRIHVHSITRFDMIGTLLNRHWEPMRALTVRFNLPATAFPAPPNQLGIFTNLMDQLSYELPE